MTESLIKSASDLEIFYKPIKSGNNPNFEETINKRNSARDSYHEWKEELLDSLHISNMRDNKLLERVCDAEYNWGFWDGVLATLTEDPKLKGVNV